MRNMLSMKKGVLGEYNSEEYTGVQLWRAQGDLNENIMEEFNERAHFTEDIWLRDNKTIDFLIDQSETSYMIELLESSNVSYKVLIENVLGNIDEAVLKKFPTRRNNVEHGNPFDWRKNPTLAEINRYLVMIASAYPMYCSVIAIGRSKQRKPINMLKISNGHPDNTLLIDGGIHGNEWTSVFATLYFIESIVRNFTRQPDYIKNRDWYVIPVLNPDGYEYSMNGDRHWRKNRYSEDGECQGVDLNRNFNHNWCRRGASPVICTSFYCGPEAFSEEETKAFKKLVDSKRFVGYVSIHTDGTKVLYPWTGPRNHEYDRKIHIQVSNEMALAMQNISGDHFITGNGQMVGITGASGMSIDYMFFDKKIRHAYMIETRGNIGEDLVQEKEILQALQEVRAGLFRFAEVLR